MDPFDFPRDPAELRKLFTAPGGRYRPFPFFILTGDISDEETITSAVARLKKLGCGGCVMLAREDVVPAFGSDDYYACCRAILDRLRKNSLCAIYSDALLPAPAPAAASASGALADANKDRSPAQADPEITAQEGQARFVTEVSGCAPGISEENLAMTLVMREYECTSGETMRRKLDASGVTMSLVGYNIDTGECVDLRDAAKGGEIVWEAPEGNWNLLQFVCRPCPESGCVNYLSYTACREFIERSYKRISDEFADYIPDTLMMTYFNGVSFAGRNRRMWDAGFNDFFRSEFGFDPAPYYPALFMDIGSETAHMKALMFECRSRMLMSGFFRAVSDFTRTSGLASSGCVADPKTTQAAWMFGDGMAYQKQSTAAAVSLSGGVGYGYNGLKLASGAADCYDKSVVLCDIYGGYAELDSDILYHSAVISLSRGCSFLMPRLPGGLSDLGQSPAYSDFVGRAQSMLRGGKHMTDIAVLYPIHSLESQAHFYDVPAEGFEYPQTPENADYMDVVNQLTDYCLRDVTVVHPDAVSEKCFVDGSVIRMANEQNPQSFKVIVIPGTSVISVKALRLISRFFDQGGKVIATTELPSGAFEYNPEGDTGVSSDAEVKELVKHIFGVTQDSVNAFTDCFHNASPNGGEAYFIPPSLTGADGTDIVDRELLSAIVDGVMPKDRADVVIEGAPKSSDNGVFGLSLPAFRAMDPGMDAMRSSRVFNCLHKSLAGCDIYYLANTTLTDFDGTVSVLSSRAVAEEWNPHTGKIRRIAPEEMKRENGRITFRFDLRSGQSDFIVLRDEQKPLFSIDSLFRSLETKSQETKFPSQSGQQ